MAVRWTSDNSALENDLLAGGPDSVSVRDMVDEFLIEVDASEPSYGALLARSFLQADLRLAQAMRGRFAQTALRQVRRVLHRAVAS